MRFLEQTFLINLFLVYAQPVSFFTALQLLNIDSQTVVIGSLILMLGLNVALITGIYYFGTITCNCDAFFSIPKSFAGGRTKCRPSTSNG